MSAKIYPTAIIANVDKVKIGKGTEIYDFAFINGGQGVTLGRYNHVAMFASVTGGGKLVTGDYVGIGPGARILTGTAHYGDGRRMSTAIPAEEQCIVRGTVTLGDDVFVGANAVIFPGVTVGEGAIVAAGAVVTHDVASWTIVGGVPARVIGERPRLHLPSSEASWKEEG